MSRLPFGSRRSRAQLGWLSLGLVWCAMLLLAQHGTLIVDELVHISQIAYFLHIEGGEFYKVLTTIPGYHLVMAAFLSTLDHITLGAARALSSLFGIVALALFWAIRRHVCPPDAQRATAQMMCLPFLFPYYFLVYTDALSLAAVLAGVLAALRGRHGWAALAMVAAIAVRQNNVLWVGFFALIAAGGTWRWTEWRSWQVWRETSRLVWPYAVPLALFLAYWMWNDSISYSRDQSKIAHPDLHFSAGNPYFMLFLAGCFFPLQVLAGLHRFVVRAKDLPWLWLLPFVLFTVFALAFEVSHPFNIVPDDFLRHRILQVVARRTDCWIAFGLIASLAACGLAFTRFASPQAWWLLPIGLLFVGASWLIEHRYTFIPFVLYLALRKPESDWAERLTLACWVPVALYFGAGVLSHRFML